MIPDMRGREAGVYGMRVVSSFAMRMWLRTVRHTRGRHSRRRVSRHRPAEAAAPARRVLGNDMRNDTVENFAQAMMKQEERLSYA